MRPYQNAVTDPDPAVSLQDTVRIDRTMLTKLDPTAISLQYRALPNYRTLPDLNAALGIDIRWHARADQFSPGKDKHPPIQIYLLSIDYLGIGRDVSSARNFEAGRRLYLFDHPRATQKSAVGEQLF